MLIAVLAGLLGMTSTVVRAMGAMTRLRLFMGGVLLLVLVIDL